MKRIGINMAWYEISIKTSIMSIDAVSNIFYSEGAKGVQITNPKDPDMDGNSSGFWDFFDPQNIKLDFDGALVTAYLDRDDITATIQVLKDKVIGLQSFGLDPGLAEIDYKIVYQEDWENEWKKYFKPFRLGNKIVIKPSWESFDVREGDIVIEIDPGNAFGSGTHETTSLCIEMIEKYIDESYTIVDVGCGSGILSIAAGLLGAKAVIGVDIDPVAVKTAAQNVELNHLKDITDIRQGDLISVITEKSEMVVANIIAEVIIELVDDIDSILKPEALFIASGIILSKIESVKNKLEISGFSIVEIVEKGDWAVVVSRKK
ncbi:MAG: 50S ribosomal protein L11 methyltransferase [Clostridia bacterium]|nr:50S ribosomal protein L11 methyltransferase [Clostridia bacterium]